MSGQIESGEQRGAREFIYDPVQDDYSGYDPDRRRPMVGENGRVVGHYVIVASGSNVVPHADGTPGSDGLRDLLVGRYSTIDHPPTGEQLGATGEE
jgi:hypothetical protein